MQTHDKVNGKIHHGFKQSPRPFTHHSGPDTLIPRSDIRQRVIKASCSRSYLGSCRPATPVTSSHHSAVLTDSSWKCLQYIQCCYIYSSSSVFGQIFHQEGSRALWVSAKPMEGTSVKDVKGKITSRYIFTNTIMISSHNHQHHHHHPHKSTDFIG